MLSKSNAKGTQQAQQIDEARKDKELSTAASAYKIAMLEDLSKDYANEVSSAQAELKKQQALLKEQSTTFELEQRKNEIQFQLASKLTELQHRKKLSKKSLQLKVFIATQADIATLLKGVPTLIHNKRRLMESANRYLNLLINRIEAMISVAEKTPFSSEISYVKTHDDLKALQKLIADQALWSNAQVMTEMSNISVPRESGLANALAQQRKAIFEISPAARDNQKYDAD